MKIYVELHHFFQLQLLSREFDKKKVGRIEEGYVFFPG